MPVMVESAAGSVMVMLRVEVPPAGIEVGVKDLATVGGVVTTRVALAAVPLPELPVVTVPVLLR
jgi:hypothetical protein